MTLYIKVSKLTDDAIIPTKAYESDAGWDLYASENATVKAGQRSVIKTGISFEIPEGWCGLIWPRSGLSVKNGIDILAGVIDSSYRGEILTCLYNTSSNPIYNFILCFLGLFRCFDLKIKKGDRIAQILFHEVPEVKMIEAETLQETERNQSGFGSTGK